MAEHSFQEVVHQWRRMCNSTSCVGCEIHKKCLKWVCDGHEGRFDGDDAKAVEIIIMQWAAEHPEPEYPTWGEWLCDNGVMLNVQTSCDPVPVYISGIGYSQPIPADIAQKLGLKPKEE